MNIRGLGYEALREIVTGGAGFIGWHVAEALVARGDEVHVLVHPLRRCGRLRIW